MNNMSQSTSEGNGAIASPTLLAGLVSTQEGNTTQTAASTLSTLIQPQQYVGEVYSIGYDSALVEIHDYHRQQVGGIASLSFLIATRINPGAPLPDYALEDTCVILLRVIDHAPLPNENEALRIRTEAAQRVNGDAATHWDERGAMDSSTHHYLSFAGIRCRVLGTFFLDDARGSGSPTLRFGADLSNYYPNRGLKVFKPIGEALEMIVNYRDQSSGASANTLTVPIGTVRYASTHRSYQGIDNVRVELTPSDLLGQKTSLFGMTRTGKSNLGKIIMKSVFEMRYAVHNQRRIGQLVFDANGEYANDNVQDATSKASNPTAIRNIWRCHPSGVRDDVVTYGVLPHINDPARKMMLLNFYSDSNSQIGKDIIDSALVADTSKYVQAFVQVSFSPPDPADKAATTRHRRRVLAYRALLAKAGFSVPQHLQPQVAGLFNQDLINALHGSTGRNMPEHQAAAAILSRKNRNPTWSEIATALSHLYDFICDRASGYETFEIAYMSRSASGERWADEDFKKILEMFRHPNGVKQLGCVREQHTPFNGTDYAHDIYNDLVMGKLVIIDQSSGDTELNKLSAERIMWHVFRANQKTFREGKQPAEILVYVEEAHNLLPASRETDMANVWVRTAKEGAKYHIGMVYATQEVSSIQGNILKNTANWFIGHLNNTDETKELCKYYDFADFESIRTGRAPDHEFLRIRTLSNMYVIQIQALKFEV